MTFRFLCLLTLLLLTSADAADTVEFKSFSCMVRFERETPLDDSITVFTLGHRIFRGKHPTINYESSSLSLKLRTEPGTWEDVTVPFDSITMIAFKKRGKNRTGMTLLGLGLGMLVGGIIGTSAAPEPDRFLEMPEIRYGFTGAVIGAFVGAVSFNLIGARMVGTVKLECD
jgi:hypothetical protein